MEGVIEILTSSFEEVGRLFRTFVSIWTDYSRPSWCGLNILSQPSMGANNSLVIQVGGQVSVPDLERNLGILIVRYHPHATLDQAKRSLTLIKPLYSRYCSPAAKTATQ